DRMDSLLCPESYLRESFGSMLFRAQPPGYGGKLVPIEVGVAEVSASAQLQSTKTDATIRPGRPWPIADESTSGPRTGNHHVQPQSRRRFRAFRGGRCLARAECGSRK